MLCLLVQVFLQSEIGQDWNIYLGMMGIKIVRYCHWDSMWGEGKNVHISQKERVGTSLLSSVTVGITTEYSV